MRTIISINANYFELDGVRFPTIFQPIVGSGDTLAIYNIYDTRQSILDQTPYSDIELDGIVHPSRAALIDALLPVIYKSVGGTASAAWGTLTGPLSSQTDLQTALDSKSAAGHTHTTSEISNLSTYTGLDGRYYTKASSDGRYSLIGHSHTASDITDLSSYTGLDSRYYTETEVDNKLLSKASASHTHAAYQLTSEKGQINGYAPLDGSGKIDPNYLPAFVDDVLEYVDLASFPATGASGVLYIAADTNFTYRWSGTTYTQIGGGGAAEVDSVFGRVGAITAQVGDYSAFYSQLGHTHSQYLLNTTDTLTGNLTVTGSGSFGGDISVGSQTGTWITSNVMTDAIGWNNSFGVYIGSNVGGTKYLRGNGTFTTGGVNYDLFHAGENILPLQDKYLEFQANSTWGAKLRVGGNGRTASGSTASVTTTNGNLHLDSGFGGYGTYLNYYAGTNGVLFGNGAGATVARMYSDGNLFKGSDQSTPYWHASNDGDFTRFRQVLGASQDLNTYTSTGMYHQNSNADAGTGTNYPLAVAGVLTVKADEGFIYQEYQTYKDYGQQYRRQYYNGAWSAWSEIWSSSEDGAGSGLDADLLDGLDSDRYHRGAVGSIAGNVDWNNYTTHGAYKVQAANMTSTYNAPNSYTYGILVVHRSEFGGEDRTLQTYYPHSSTLAPQTRMRNGAGWTSWMTRWNDNGNNTTSGAVGALRFHTGYDSGITASFSCSNWFRSSGTTGWYNQSYGGGIYMTDSNNVRVYASKGLQLDGGGSLFFSDNATGVIQRHESNAGYLVGSYNHAGANQGQTNPIYTIGSNYKPALTTLGNMYGVGFSDGGNASFLNSTDLGTNPTGWGLYVAAAGVARHFLNGNNGISYQSGVAYASNFILNSDRRRKNNIKEYDPTDLQVQWKSFELNTEEGVFRVGVVAQELLETNPEFVDQSSPESLTVKYIDLHSASLAKKDKEIADLTQRIEKLEELILKTK